MPHRRSPSPTRTFSLCCCQIKAWKAGHKRECAAAARADIRTAAKPTADQVRVLKILEQLDDAADWRGAAAQERAAKAVAAAVRTSMPGYASFVYCTLGNAHNALGTFSKAIEYHKEHLTMAKEVDDRAGEGMAYGNLGNVYRSLGDLSKAREYQMQQMAIAKEVGDRAGEVRAYANLGNVYDVRCAGGLFQGHQLPHAVPADCKGGGRPGGGGQGVLEPQECVQVAGGL
jgi:tetratricopeptide (TPR) repeat protein